MLEIAASPPGIHIDESDSDEQSMDSDGTSVNAQTATSDSNDYSFTDDASDGESLPRHSFTDYMKAHTLIERALTTHKNPERMQSRKMQHHFSQAYIPTKTSTLLSAASVTPNNFTGPVCSAEPSIDHTLLTKIKTHLNTDDDLPTAVSPPSGHPTKRKVHVPNDGDGDSIPCKTSRCPRCCSGNHSVPDNAMNLDSTAQETRKTENDQIADSDGEGDSHRVFPFPCSCTYSTSTLSSDAKTPSASIGEPQCTYEQLTDDVEEGTGIRTASSLPQTPIGATATDARVSPNATSFPLLPVVDTARLPALPIEHLGPSIECVAFDSPFVACKVDERHVPLSSSLIPSLPFLHSTPLYDPYSATDGSKLLANDGVSSLTSIFPTPVFISSTPSINPPSYGAALNVHPLAFRNLPEQMPCAEQPVYTLSGPSLGATTYCGFTAEPFWSGPFTSGLLGMSSDHVSFVTSDDIHASKGPLPQPQWISHSNHIDVEMADAEVVVEFAMPTPDQCFAKPSAGLNAPGPFLGYAPTQIPAAAATYYVYTNEPPVAISAFSGVSTALSAVGPSSDGFSTIVEPTYYQPAFDSTAFSTPVPEQYTELSGSRFIDPYSGPSEMPSAEQDVYTRERDIEVNTRQVNHLHTIRENEEYAHPKVDDREHAVSQSILAPYNVIQETVVQPVGHDNDVTAPVRRQPQYIAPSAASITGKGPAARDGKKAHSDDDAKTEPDDDTKTEPDDDAKTEPDDEINEKDVNADVLAHAILDIPLPPAVVASVQLLGQRKCRNSSCSAGITRMRVRRRQINTGENEKDGKGGIRAQRTRFNRVFRPSPYGSVTPRRKGQVKRLEKGGDDSLGGPHSEASMQSGAILQTSGVESGDNSQLRSPFKSVYPQLIQIARTRDHPSSGHLAL
ncbi:hypothetical protein DFH29DRAFT_1005599 [Suillus ampliporus]|nr:hypothetical protein DFH29DRAFT_1005599 [Suillus ampliporus]